MTSKWLHDAEVCGTCVRVADPEFIRVTPKQRAEATITLAKKLRELAGFFDPEDAIVFLGRFTLLGWPGHEAFWLFTCPNCQRQNVDYLHGTDDLYLECSDCQARVGVVGQRFYEERDQNRTSITQ